VRSCAWHHPGDCIATPPTPSCITADTILILRFLSKPFALAALPRKIRSILDAEPFDLARVAKNGAQ